MRSTPGGDLSYELLYIPIFNRERLGVSDTATREDWRVYLAKGGAKRKVCKAACIGCRKCVKESEDGQIAMDGFLARVNYQDAPSAAVAEVCPTKCLRILPACLETEKDKVLEVADG